ncbi:MAG TPA: hypothetical protein VIJ66_07925 [Solirubrobacteraceae bacterium]
MGASIDARTKRLTLLVLFLQQIGGYTPLQSGLATLPVTVIMFVLSRRFGALADRFGPRFFMGAGPLVAACGLLLFQRIGTKVDYVSEVLPGLLVFALGLSMTVAPVTQAKRLPLGRPNVHGLLSAQASALTKAAEQASLHSFHLGMAIAGALVAVGGIVGVVGIRNPKGEIPAETCPGGQLVGASSGIASRAAAEPTGSAV